MQGLVANGVHARELAENVATCWSFSLTIVSDVAGQQLPAEPLAQQDKRAQISQRGELYLATPVTWVIDSTVQ